MRERDITRGLRWLLDNHRRYGIDIVNISVGGDRSGLDRNSVIDGLVRRLVREGVVVVAASGNAGQSDLYPARLGRRGDHRGRHRRPECARSRPPAHVRQQLGAHGQLAASSRKWSAPSIWLAAPVLPGTHIAEQNLLLDRLWRADDEELPALLASTYQVLDFPAQFAATVPARTAPVDPR